MQAEELEEAAPIETTFTAAGRKSLLELAVTERLRQGPGEAKPVEEVARELGLAAELGVG